MTQPAGDLTRQWWNLFKTFPPDQQDEEIATWVAQRKIGALISLFEADRNEAREALRDLRRRYSKDFARAQKEYRGEYEWDEDGRADDDDDELTDRQWEEREQQRDKQEAEYEWVEEQYRTRLNVVQNRSRLIDRIRELEVLEGRNEA